MNSRSLAAILAPGALPLSLLRLRRLPCEPEEGGVGLSRPLPQQARDWERTRATTTRVPPGLLVAAAGRRRPLTGAAAHSMEAVVRRRADLFHGTGR